MKTDTHRLVLLDPGRQNTDPTIGELFAGGHGTVAPVVLDPLSSVDPRAFRNLPERVAEHVAWLGAADGVANVLIAHCMNSVLAGELAAAMTDSGFGPTRLVLFDPFLVDHEVITDQTAELFAGLGEPRPEARLSAQRIWGAARPVEHALASAQQDLRKFALHRAAAFDLDEDEVEAFADQLTDRYARWLSHLASQFDAEITPAKTPIDLVVRDTAGDHTAVLAWGGPIRVHSYPEPVGFDTPGLRELLREILTGAAPSRYEITGER